MTGDDRFVGGDIPAEGQPDDNSLPEGQSDGNPGEEQPDDNTSSGGWATAPPYVESPVIKTAARTVAPFVFVYGAFFTLHGTSLPGGGFQGGVVLGATVVLIALAFGFEPTRAWVDERVLVGTFLFSAGVFAAVAFVPLLFDEMLLDVFVVPGPTVWTAKLLEVAIGVLVGSVVAGLILLTATGDSHSWEGET